MSKLNKKVLFKAMRYVVPGFIVGAAITVLAMLLVFVSIGALGLQSPLMGLFPAVFCALLGALGFNTGVSVGYAVRQPLSDEDFEIQMLAPAAGFISGGLAVVMFRFVSPGNSLYVGMITLVLVSMVLVWFFFSKKAFKTREREFYKRNTKRYAITGVVATILLSLLSWSFFTLAAGVVFIAFALFRQKRTLVPLKEKELEKPKKRVRLKSIFVLSLIVAVLCGLLGWYIFPYAAGGRGVFAGCMALVCLPVFVLGAIAGLFSGKTPVPEKKKNTLPDGEIADLKV